MKKVLQLSTIVASALLASTAIASTSSYFVAGIDGGYAWRKATPFTLLGPVKRDYASDLKDDGGIFGLFAGYQVTTPDILAGFELNLGWQNFGDTKSYADLVNTTLPPGVPTPTAYAVSAKFKREMVVSASFRLGYFFLDQLAGYLRAGVEGSHDRVDITSTAIAGVPVGATIDSSSKSAFRPLLGAGLEYFVTPSISVRGEYNYLHKSGAFATIHSPAPVLDIYVEPRQHNLKAAVAWNFA